MHPLVIRFIKASLIWFALASTFGMLLTIPATRDALFGLGGVPGRMHGHMMLAGFMSNIVIGVAYHILPRFLGQELHSYPTGYLHFWTGNIGLVGLALAFLIKGVSALLPVFGVTVGVSFLLFVYNIWSTFTASEKGEMRA